MKAVRSWGPTILLTLAFTWSYVDRHIFSLLVEPIKASLAISDARIGLIHGISFSLFTVIATLPLAWLADRGNRPRLIAWCIAGWSLMTMACGLSTHWLHLLLARTGVAIGEAGMPPSVLSYLTDTVDRSRLSRASSFFLLGPFIGGGLAMFVGGALYAASAGWSIGDWPLVGGLERWQLLFMIVGAPGLLFAAAVMTLREASSSGRSGRKATPFTEVLAYIGGIRSFFVPYCVSLALLALIYNAYIIWLPATLMRDHQMSMVDAGIVVGTIFLGAGGTGTLLSGWFVSRQGEARALPRAIQVIAIACGLIWPVACLAPFAPSAIAACLYGLAIFLTSAIFGIGAYPFQIMAPPHIRARTIGAYLMIISLTGAGIGPIAVGALSDVFQNLSLALGVVGSAATTISVALMMLALRNLGRLHGDATALPGGSWQAAT